MKYNRLMRLTPIASNPLPTSNLFTCTYGEIFRVRYRTGFPAAEVTGHNTKYRIANYPMGKAYRTQREDLQQLFQCMTTSH